MKLLRTIRLDPSDTFIFPLAAAPGDWAIPGTFVFADREPTTFEGKQLSAFRSGFLGVPSLGWSTLAQIVEADEKDRGIAIDLLARCLLERFGAPDLAAAHRAAEEEIDFAASLCGHPPNTLIALRRSYDRGAIREAFRTLRSRDTPTHSRGFSVIEVEIDEGPDEAVDLAALARGDGA